MEGLFVSWRHRRKYLVLFREELKALMMGEEKQRQEEGNNAMESKPTWQRTAMVWKAAVDSRKN